MYIFGFRPIRRLGLVRLKRILLIFQVQQTVHCGQRQT